MKILILTQVLVLVASFSFTGTVLADNVGLESTKNTSPDTRALVDIIGLVEAPVPVDETLKARLSETRVLLNTVVRYAARFDKLLAQLETNGRLRDVELQTVMDHYNQFSGLASAVLKKRDETAKDLLDKL